MHLLTTSGMPSVRFVCVRDVKLNTVSDWVSELLQQLTSGLNQSKRQQFLVISLNAEKY